MLWYLFNKVAEPATLYKVAEPQRLQQRRFPVDITTKFFYCFDEYLQTVAFVIRHKSEKP